jgi:hypothetical protein
MPVAGAGTVIDGGNGGAVGNGFGNGVGGGKGGAEDVGGVGDGWSVSVMVVLAAG